MITVVLVIHLLIAVALIGVVLLQKSEGGALGMGGGGMSGFMTGRSTANLLTRTTAILAALLLRDLGRARRCWPRNQRAPHSIIDQGPASLSAPHSPRRPRRNRRRSKARPPLRPSRRRQLSPRRRSRNNFARQARRTARRRPL